MIKINLLRPEDFEKPEIETLKEVIAKIKPLIEQDPHHRAYILLSELKKLFPGKREDRYDESVINNLRKYFNYYNQNYCNDGTYYKSGIAWSKYGEKVIYIEEIKHKKIDFETISSAEIIDDNNEEGKIKIGGRNINIPDDVKEKIEQKLKDNHLENIEDK